MNVARITFPVSTAIGGLLLASCATLAAQEATPPRPAIDAYLARLSGGATLILDGAERQLPAIDVALNF